MRDQEEIIACLRDKKPFLKSDLYQVSMIELYPFVPAEYIPQVHRDRIDPKVIADWNPQEERDNFNVSQEIKDEVNYLYKLVNNDKVNEAVFRTPRLFAKVWLNGDSVEEYDKQLGDIIKAHVTANVAKSRLKKIYRSIVRMYK